MKYTGYAVVAESVPDLAGVLTRGLGIDRQAFAAWLAPRLERYRLDELMRAQATTRKVELAGLRALDASLRSAAEAIGGLPPVGEALMRDALYRARGAHLHEIAERTLLDLRLLLALAEQAAAAIRDAGPHRAGRRPDAARDRLLSDVLVKLGEAGLKAEVARSVAQQVLDRCGVLTAAHGRSIRRAAKRANELGPK